MLIRNNFSTNERLFTLKNNTFLLQKQNIYERKYQVFYLAKKIH